MINATWGRAWGVGVYGNGEWVGVDVWGVGLGWKKEDLVSTVGIELFLEERLTLLSYSRKLN